MSVLILAMPPAPFATIVSGGVEVHVYSAEGLEAALRLAKASVQQLTEFDGKKSTTDDQYAVQQVLFSQQLKEFDGNERAASSAVQDPPLAMVDRADEYAVQQSKLGPQVFSLSGEGDEGDEDDGGLEVMYMALDPVKYTAQQTVDDGSLRKKGLEAVYPVDPVDVHAAQQLSGVASLRNEDLEVTDLVGPPRRQVRSAAGV